MSAGEQQAATSFGDPNARPPTPHRTPTSDCLASPLLQTPKQTFGGRSHFDDACTWTPRFAEEYSVFNSTPGNLGPSSSGGAFFAPASPVALQSAGRKRQLSTTGLGIDTASEAATHPSSAVSSAPASADACLQRLSSSSPDPHLPSHEDAPAAAAESANGTQPPRAKKHRTVSVSSASSAKSPPPLAPRQTQQTATPPPSSRGGRKLAPKSRRMARMQQQQQQQQDQGFAQPSFASAAPPQQPALDTSFVGNDDVFGYAMAPATAPPVVGPRFWGFDMDANGMAIDVDLATSGTDLFGPVQSQGHSQMGSMDWGRAPPGFEQSEGTQPVFEQSGMATQAGPHAQQQQTEPSPQQHSQKLPRNQSSRRERPLAPKTTNIAATQNMQSPSQNFDYGQMQMPMGNNPFSASPGGVDPGMLFSQPPLSTGMDSSAMSMSMSMSMSMPVEQPTSVIEQTAGAVAPVTKTTGNAPSLSGRQGSAPGTGQERGRQQRKQASRPPAVSPTKNAGRPNLSRSFSDSARNGKRTAGSGRSLLPALAPSRPVTVHQPNLPPPPPASQQTSNRPQPQGGPSGAGGGRRSPLKSSHHHRLSSLTAIPENASHLFARSTSAKRTSVKFVIDDNGRARAETIVDDDDFPEPEPEPEFEPVLPISSSQHSAAPRNSWAGAYSVSTPGPVSDDEDYSSSSDDEPIIIPSRNTSFNYPVPPKSSGSGNSRPPTGSSSIFSQQRLHPRSFSDRLSFSQQGSQFDPDNNNAMDIDPPQHHQQYPPPPRPSTGGSGSLGDAASELRKVMQAGNPARRSGSGQQPPPLLGGSGHRQRVTPGQRSSSSTISEASLPSPSHGREQSQVRCVCNRSEAGDGVFLVKCDSCDSLLHGRCIAMPTLHDRPHVFICAFCANTPNMRGGRLRYTGSDGPQAAAAASPLAHKSFRAFR